MVWARLFKRFCARRELPLRMKKSGTKYRSQSQSFISTAHQQTIARNQKLLQSNSHLRSELEKLQNADKKLARVVQSSQDLYKEVGVLRKNDGELRSIKRAMDISDLGPEQTIEYVNQFIADRQRALDQN